MIHPNSISYVWGLIKKERGRVAEKPEWSQITTKEEGKKKKKEQVK